jgi:hypothetical protein
MSEFVGRTGSLRVYSYPEPRRSSGESALFARNFALGVKNAIDATDGVQIRWPTIDVPPSAPITPCDSNGCVDVPITPLSTGIVLVSGAISITNSGDAPTTVTINVQVNGSSLLNPTFIATIADGTTEVIPILVETDPAETPVGVTTHIEVFVLGDSMFVAADGCTLSLQEVSVATG